MDSEALQFLGHLEALGPLHAFLETVVHVHLDNHSDVVACSLHHLADDHAHEAHPVLERPAELVMAVVGVRREELADQIAVSRMYLHAVETGFPGEVDSIAEGID